MDGLSGVRFLDPQEEELKRRMAMAKSQGWSDDEIQRSAAYERALSRQSAPVATAAPSDEGGGLAEALLNFVPFGNIARKAVTGQGDQITPGEVAMEAALTAVPFGLGRVAKGVKAAKGAAKTAKATKAATKATPTAAPTSTKPFDPSRIPYADKATKAKQIEDLLAGVKPDESDLPIQNGARVPFITPAEAAKKTERVVSGSESVQNTADLADAATQATTPDSLLSKTADKLTRVSSIAPTSTIDSALQQQRIIDLTQRIPELRGSAARKFQNTERVIDGLARQVDETLKDVPNTMPAQQFRSSFDTVAASLTGPDKLNFERFLNRAQNRVFGRKGMPETITPTQVNSMLREVNGQLSGVFRKKQMGTTLTAQDEGLLTLYEELKDQLYSLTPEQLQPVIRQLNQDQSTLIQALPEFKKASEQRVNIMGMTLPGSKAPYQAVQAGADATARGINAVDGAVPRSGMVPFLAKQAGVRAGADLLGLRGGEGQIPAEQSPDALLAQSAGVPAMAGGGAGAGDILGQMNQKTQLQKALEQDFIMTGGENFKALKEIYGGGEEQKLSAAQQKQLMGTSTANSIVDQIEGELGALAEQGNQGRIGGLIGKAQGAIGLNDTVQSYEASRPSKALMIIKAVMGSAGSISDADRAAIEGAIPSAMDTAGERMQKLQSLRSIISAYEGGAMAGAPTSEDDLLSILNGL